MRRGREEHAQVTQVTQVIRVGYGLWQAIRRFLLPSILRSFDPSIGDLCFCLPSVVIFHVERYNGQL